LERERDKAREDLNNMQDQRDLAMKVIKRLEQERNEARDMVEKLTEQGLDLMDENRSLKLEIKKLKKKYE
jgi:regulator of replication initiation timing